MKIERKTLISYLENQESIAKSDFDYLQQAQRLVNNDFLELDPKGISNNLLQFIIFNDTSLDYETKAKITLEYIKPKDNSKDNFESDFWTTKIKGLTTIIDIYEKYLKQLDYNFDLLFDNKYFPVNVKIELFNATRNSPRQVRVSYILQFEKTKMLFEYHFIHEDIIRLKAYYKDLSFLDLFKTINLNPQKSNLTHYKETMEYCNELRLKAGIQYIVNGKGVLLTSINRYSKMLLDNLNTTPHDGRVIIENELEYDERDNRESSEIKINVMPYIRVFSLLRKDYYFVSVNEVQPYKYDKSAINKLVLPEDYRMILNKLFTYDNNNIYKDLVLHKGGGLIILAEGETGTGKTSTAEVFAELREKPLYIINVEEIGTSLGEIEKNIKKILERIHKWDAILLFDEVDIFLSKRDDNLNKSAIVGIFLRLFEYFKGIIFFTTNRVNSIDEAVMSRVTLRIKYPNFNEDTREKIWKINLQEANIELKSVKKLATYPMNGRDIRNYIKLTSMLFGQDAKEDTIIDLIERFPKS